MLGGKPRGSSGRDDDDEARVEVTRRIRQPRNHPINRAVST